MGVNNIFTNNTIPPDLNKGFETFIGFLYGLLVTLVIKTAYLHSKFNSIVPVVFTLILLIFFAYDWTTRFVARLKMHKDIINAKSYNNFFKLILDIFIVYFLLLFSLKLVELYGSLNLDKIFKLHVFDTIVPSLPLCHSMASFALLSGVWNAMMIGISTKVNKPQIFYLFKGHLDSAIVDVFPAIIVWRKNLINFKTKKLKEITELKINAPCDTDDEKDKYIKEHARLVRDIKIRLHFKCLVFNPHHIVLPYFLALQVVALNFILGIFIFFSAFSWETKSLFSKIKFLQGTYVLFWSFPLGIIISSILLIWHSASSLDNKVTLKERFGFYILFMTILWSYFFLSAVYLMALVIIQQLIANSLMNKYYNPNNKSEANP